jgi:16S rRNA (cytosine967-C5)-methyltransferase
MSISPARVAAFDILLRVEQEAAYAAELLHSPRLEKLSPADHRLATELAMGVLRWRSFLDQEIAERSSSPLERLDLEVLTALRLGAYQIQFLERVPQRAAVHESVELIKRARKRSAAPFVNAVLRKLAKTSPHQALAAIAGAQTAAELGERSAHPSWLIERWEREYGHDTTGKICTYDQQVPETAIRLASPAVEEKLRIDGIQLKPGRMLASARRVQSGDVTKTSAFREGRVMIQDEASQLVALLLGNGTRFLDCCAAPGGKTRILAARNPAASITAVELYTHRARLLRRLAPEKNIEVIAADVCALPIAGSFDCVLADVPCSGTGTLARNPEIKWRLKPDDLVDFQARQIVILQSAMQQVAPGGRLIYSTCSLEDEENTAVVERALGEEPLFRIGDCRSELQKLWNDGELVWTDLDSLTSGPYLRTIPGVHPADGFFAAILQKT